MLSILHTFLLSAKLTHTPISEIIPTISIIWSLYFLTIFISHGHFDLYYWDITLVTHVIYIIICIYLFASSFKLEPNDI